MAISQYSILILEDSPEDRSLYCRYLSQDILATYNVVEMETGLEALTYLSQNKPDLILLDYQLPDLDGLEFLDQLRLQFEGLQIPVIMLTGLGDETIAAQAIKSGAAEYLVKGKLTSAKLCHIVYSTLEKSRLMQQLRMQEQQQLLLARILLRIRQFLRLEEILSTAVQEVREFLKADRVIVYQFDYEMNGEITAESVLPQWSTCLYCQIQDTCFRENQGIAYRDGKIRAISDIYNAELTACHIDLLEQFDVKANLVVPILLNTEARENTSLLSVYNSSASATTHQLWGLLIAHQCSKTREWEIHELELLEQLAVHLAVAIQQAELYENLQNLNTSLEQKAKERTQALQASERRFRAIFNNTFQFTGLLTTEGILLEANQTALNFGGIQLEDVINRPFWETYWWTISHSTQDRLKQAIACAAQGEFIRYEVDILGAGGEIATIDFSLRPVKDESGQVVMLIPEGRDISDKKRLEHEYQKAVEALKASEAELRGLFNAMVDVILVVDKYGRYLKIAPTGADKLYLPAEDLIGKTAHEVLPHQLADQFVSLIGQTLATQQTLECEYSLQIGNQEVWFNAKVSPISPETVIWTARDITEAKRNETIRQQTEQAFQESQILLQVVMDSLPIAIFWKDRNSRFLGCNRQLLLDAGLSSLAEIIGKTDFDMVWREQAPLYQEDDRIVMESGQAKFNIEEPITKHGNRHQWLRTNKIPLHNSDGEIIGVLASYEDITERKEIEQALQESKRRYATLAASAPVGIFRTDVEGHGLYVNDRWCQIAGLTPEESLGLGWFKALHPEDQEMVVEEWSRCTKIGATFSLEYRFRRPDGVESWVFGQAVPEKNLDGSVVGYIGTVTDISSRKQAEDALRDSEEKFRQFAENNRGVILLRQVDSGELLYVNPAYERIWGQTCESLYQHPDSWMAYIHPDDRERIDAAYKATDGKGMCNEEYRIIRPDGAIRWIWEQCFPIRDVFGEIYRVGAIAEDITDRKQTEQERDRLLQTLEQQNQTLEAQVAQRTAKLRSAEVQLRNLSDRLKLAVKSAKIGIWDWDLVNNSLVWDERMYQLFGVSPMNFDPSYGAWEKFEHLLHADDRVPIRKTLQEIIAEHKELDTEFRIILPNGTSRIIKAYGLVQRNSQGQPQRMIGINYDISDRKQAEAEILRSRDLREAIFNESADALFLVDIETVKTIDCNQRAVEMFAATDKTNLIGIEGHQLQNQQFSPEEIQAIMDEMRNTGLWSREIEYKTFTGNLFWGNLAAKEITVAGQKMNLVRVTDISQRKLAEAQLQQTNEQLAASNAELARATRLKDEFLANMSHELRTPLNAVLGISEALQDGVYGVITEKQRQGLQTIERSGNHLLALINDILDLSKIEAGQLKLDYTPVAISQLCQSSLAFIKQQAFQKRIQLQVNIESQLPKLLLDERRIRQVLINLLNNAVKFTPEGGRITLEVTRHRLAPEVEMTTMQDFIRLAVIDTGIGIAPENLNKLFQAFVQIDSALNRQYNGTGLGLALVKRLVEMHGGKVGVSSELGVGSCFTVDLPCGGVSDTSPEPVKQVSPALNSTLHEAQEHLPLILLAEDNEGNLFTISNYLEAIGYRIILAKNGDEAIALTKAQVPNLILMDIQMPGVDGLDAIKQIRLDQNFAHIPIIALTALAMPGDRERCLAAGANDYITKPIKLKQLATIIKQLLGFNTNSL